MAMTQEPKEPKLEVPTIRPIELNDLEMGDFTKLVFLNDLAKKK
jgi:hypothetical protein